MRLCLASTHSTGKITVRVEGNGEEKSKRLILKVINSEIVGTKQWQLGGKGSIEDFEDCDRKIRLPRNESDSTSSSIALPTILLVPQKGTRMAFLRPNSLFRVV